MTVRKVWPALIALALAQAPEVTWPAPAPIVAWTYTVQPGDTLATVAARMGVSPGDLARTNGIGLGAPLVAGTILKRPDPAGMPSERRPPRRPPAPPRAIPVARPAPSPRPLPEPAPVHRPEPGAPRLVWPTSGAVITRFAAPVHGQADNGIDLAAFAGMPVRAAADGRVIFAGTERERFGQLIVIDHGGGWATAYAYLGKVVVADGQTVRAGSVIARIGASGEAKKPTLHFELRHDNVPRDPLPTLPPRL